MHRTPLRQLILPSRGTTGICVEAKKKATSISHKMGSKEEVLCPRSFVITVISRRVFVSSRVFSYWIAYSTEWHYYDNENHIAI